MRVIIVKYPIQPLTFRLLVQPENISYKSKGGIYLGTETQMKKEKNAVFTGKVLEKGPAAGKYFESEYDCEWPVEVGDYIYFKSYHGHFFKLPDNPDVEYIILNDEDVMGILNPEYIEEDKYV